MSACIQQVDCQVQMKTIFQLPAHLNAFVCVSLSTTSELSVERDISLLLWRLLTYMWRVYEFTWCPLQGCENIKRGQHMYENSL
mmetsp:Transcript_21199/g.33898  ORF Transcript_21199/g.33898 Transcript_21199/m.33898 type:complete len:84 (+) Transcript_21199:680-931(+)